MGSLFNFIYFIIGFCFLCLAVCTFIVSIKYPNNKYSAIVCLFTTLMDLFVGCFFVYMCLL